MEVSDMAIELNRDNYEAEVNGADKPVLVDFWGPRCGPCLVLMPSVEQLEQEYEGRIKVAKLNATENRMLCARLRVMGLPTFILYKDGTEVRRLTGEKITVHEIREAVEALLR
jgi:thioredoxin 1